MKTCPVTVLCAVMRVRRSGFYHYLDRLKKPKNRPDDAALQKRIKEIFDESRSSYGSSRAAKQLALDALDMDCWQRKPSEGLLHHSDRGSQYTCHDYRNRLEAYGMKAAMSRKDSCWENAPTERFFLSLKSDRLTPCRFFYHKEAKMEIRNYITFYNSIRFHSTLRYVSPMNYEKEKFLKVA